MTGPSAFCTKVSIIHILDYPIVNCRRNSYEDNDQWSKENARNEISESYSHRNDSIYMPST